MGMGMGMGMGAMESIGEVIPVQLLGLLRNLQLLSFRFYKHHIR